MSKSNAFETALLQHIFQNANIANIGDATGVRGSTTAGNLYVSLHSADPGEAGDQTTNEVSYGGYARVGNARTAGAFPVAGNVVNLGFNNTFPQASSGSVVATHFGIGVNSAGAGLLLYSGPITPNITIVTGVQPILTTASNIAED